ncbi:MAG: ribosomal RNA small subunit methyltransferase A [Gemmatimonadota bacterium]|nr:MAG: ribosomal RNA small subunit methyltransferase A [Gemmatimonadota bacterium]
MTPARPRAKRSLSQNFLIDPNLQRKIVEALDPEPADIVLEIGAGTGALTHHLAGRVARLVAVELDDALAESLAAEFEGRADVQVVHADALEIAAERLAGAPDYKVIGNIPYGITTPIIFHLLDERPRPRVIVLTVQREVADRLVAKPGNKTYGALTAGVQAVAGVEALFKISRQAFRPVPDVDSTVVRIVPKRPPPLSPAEEEKFRTLTRAAFSRRRKQLQKVLRQAPELGLSSPQVDSLLSDLRIDPATRPDALPVADYIRLAAALQPDRR